MADIIKLQTRLNALKREHAEISEISKEAFMAAPPAPAAAPPMDPAMMGGAMPPAAPPMDPAMMGGAMPPDPSMMGAPPMDPSAMGQPPVDPAMAAAPPIDPSIIDQLLDVIEQQATTLESQGAAIAELQQVVEGLQSDVDDIGQRASSLAATTPQNDWS